MRFGLCLPLLSLPLWSGEETVAASRWAPSQSHSGRGRVVTRKHGRDAVWGSVVVVRILGEGERGKRGDLSDQPHRRWTPTPRSRSRRSSHATDASRMSGTAAAAGSASCRFAHYFVECGVDTDTGLEPDDAAGRRVQRIHSLHVKAHPGSSFFATHLLFYVK